jgi:hypothetical protein
MGRVERPEWQLQIEADNHINATEYLELVGDCRSFWALVPHGEISKYAPYQNSPLGRQKIRAPQ